MGLTNFPNGIASFGIPVMPNSNVGNVFWVYSGTGSDSGSADGSFASPFATINYAISRCTASNDDAINVKAGHTETISAAAGIAANKAGVSIFGYGNGTLRPIVTFATSTAATLTVTASNVRISNIQFQNAIDSLVVGISITAAGCKIDHCTFTSPVATNDALTWIGTSAAADDLEISDNDFRQNHAGPTECITLVGVDRLKILRNYITGSYSTAAINGTTTLSSEVLISGNTLTNSVTDALLILMYTASTGRIEYNNGTVVSTAGWTASNIITATSCQLAQNYVSDAVGETGKLLGTVSA